MNSLKFKEKRSHNNNSKFEHAFKFKIWDERIIEKYLKNHLKRVSWKIHKGQLNEQWTNNDSSSNEGKKSLCVYLNITLGMMHTYVYDGMCFLLLLDVVIAVYRNFTPELRRWRVNKWHFLLFFINPPLTRSLYSHAISINAAAAAASWQKGKITHDACWCC